MKSSKSKISRRKSKKIYGWLSLPSNFSWGRIFLLSWWPRQTKSGSERWSRSTKTIQSTQSRPQRSPSQASLRTWRTFWKFKLTKEIPLKSTWKRCMRTSCRPSPMNSKLTSKTRTTKTQTKIKTWKHTTTMHSATMNTSRRKCFPRTVEIIKPSHSWGCSSSSRKTRRTSLGRWKNGRTLNCRDSWLS